MKSKAAGVAGAGAGDEDDEDGDAEGVDDADEDDDGDDDDEDVKRMEQAELVDGGGLQSLQQDVQWLSCFQRFFLGLLPLPSVLRILDAYLSEGRKVLYRTGVALLRMHKRWARDHGGGQGGYGNIHTPKQWWASVQAFVHSDEYSIDDTLSLVRLSYSWTFEISRAEHLASCCCENCITGFCACHIHNLS